MFTVFLRFKQCGCVHVKSLSLIPRFEKAVYFWFVCSLQQCTLCTTRWHQIRFTKNHMAKSRENLLCPGAPVVELGGKSCPVYTPCTTQHYKSTVRRMCLKLASYFSEIYGNQTQPITKISPFY